VAPIPGGEDGRFLSFVWIRFSFRFDCLDADAVFLFWEFGGSETFSKCWLFSLQNASFCDEYFIRYGRTTLSRGFA
jgi:hypothetical protein